MTPLLLHLPHDSIVIPADAAADFLLTSEELRQELLLLTDWHTADLYAADANPVEVVRAEVSRFVVDVERFPDDRDEPCAKVGMGATYVRTCAGQPLRVLTTERRAELMERYYGPLADAGRLLGATRDWEWHASGAHRPGTPCVGGGFLSSSWLRRRRERSVQRHDGAEPLFR